MTTHTLSTLSSTPLTIRIRECTTSAGVFWAACVAHEEDEAIAVHDVLVKDFATADTEPEIEAKILAKINGMGFRFWEVLIEYSFDDFR